MFQQPKDFTAATPVPDPAVAPLQPEPAQAETSAAPATPDAAARELHGFDLAFAWERRPLIVSCIAGALLLALLVELLVTPRYRATTQIMIGPMDLRVIENAVVPTGQSLDANVTQVESQARILTSDRVLLRVIEGQHLLQDPEFGSGEASILSRLRSWITPDVKVKADPELVALRQLQRSVTAKRNERTYVVDLMVESRDPDKSARLANAIAQAYVDEEAAARADAARRAGDSVSARLSELRERLRQAEEQVESYKRDHNIIGAGGRLIEEQQLTELNNQLTTVRARAAEAQARYQQLARLQRSGADPGATAEAVQSATVGRLREMYAAATRQEATLAAELGPRHPWVIDARAQKRDAERAISQEIARVTKASLNDYERLGANEKSLAASLEALRQRTIETNLAFVKLRELEREADASRGVYETFLIRAREMREQERLYTSNVRVLSEARPPQERAWPPRHLVLLGAAIVAGLLVGIAAAYLAAFGGAAFRGLRRRGA